MYGDSYTRQHIKAGHGVIGISFNEITYPPHVVAYERAGDTVGYFLQPSQYLYDRQKSDRFILNALQMSCFKMPRLRNTSEIISREQAERMMLELTSDDERNAPVRPSIVGGSLITDAVFTAWNNFNLSLSGMTMQRLVGSIDEAVYTYSIASVRY